MTCPALVTFVTLKVPVVAGPNKLFLVCGIKCFWRCEKKKKKKKKKKRFG